MHALLRVETLPHRLWEPAAGRGAIVNVLRAAGHEVLASDLVDYGEPTHFPRRDFLLERKAPDGCELVSTNPPFRLANEFVAHALDLCPRVIMLLRLGFLRVGTPSQDPRRPRTGADLRVSQSAPHNASRQLAGAEGEQRNVLCVVVLGPGAYR